jgi:hypothetical protein
MFDKVKSVFVPENTVSTNGKIANLDLTTKRDPQVQSQQEKIDAFLNKTPDYNVAIAPPVGYSGDIMENLRKAAKESLAAHEAKVSYANESKDNDNKDAAASFRNAVDEHLATRPVNPETPKIIDVEHAPEIQMAAEIENTMKARIESPVSVEKVLFTKDILSRQKLTVLEKKFKDTPTENVIKLVIEERKMQSSEIQGALDIKSVKEHIDAHRENVSRSKDSLISLTEKMTEHINNEDPQAIDDMLSRIGLENRTLKNSKKEMESLESKLVKLETDTKIDISNRAKTIEKTRMSLAEKGINFEKVISALAGLESIKARTEEKATEVGLTRVDSSENEEVLVDTPRNASEELKAKYDLISSIASKPNEGQKTKGMLSVLKSLFSRRVTKLVGAFAFLGLVAISPVGDGKVAAVQKASTEMINIDPIMPTKMSLPNHEQGKIIQASLPPAATENVQPSYEQNLAEEDLNSDEVEKLLEDKEYTFKQNEGMIHAYKAVIRFMRDEMRDDRVDNNIKLRASEMMRKDISITGKTIVNSPENYKKYVDAAITELAVKINNTKSKSEKREVYDYELKDGKYGFDIDAKVGESVSYKQIYKDMMRNYKLNTVSI